VGEEPLVIEENADGLRIALAPPGFGSAFVLRLVVVLSFGIVPVLVVGRSIAAP
jgi:hypothetical protein